MRLPHRCCGLLVGGHRACNSTADARGVSTGARGGRTRVGGPPEGLRGRHTGRLRGAPCTCQRVQSGSNRPTRCRLDPYAARAGPRARPGRPQRPTPLPPRSTSWPPSARRRCAGTAPSAARAGGPRGGGGRLRGGAQLGALTPLRPRSTHVGIAARRGWGVRGLTRELAAVQRLLGRHMERLRDEPVYAFVACVSRHDACSASLLRRLAPLVLPSLKEPLELDQNLHFRGDDKPRQIGAFFWRNGQGVL